MNKSKFKVGDKVVLNDKGLEILFGNSKGLSYMKTKILTITEITNEIPLHTGVTHLYYTDDPEINIFLVFSECFDIAPRILLV
jgi:hypothetical protein